MFLNLHHSAHGLLRVNKTSFGYFQMFHCCGCLSSKTLSSVGEQFEANMKSGAGSNVKSVTVFPYQPQIPHSLGLPCQTIIHNQHCQSKQKLQGIGIMPQTFYLWLLRSRAAPLNYRRTSRTPRNLISFLEIRPGNAEEAAMHTAVSKTITREQFPCFPSLFTDWRKMSRSNSVP